MATATVVMTAHEYTLSQHFTKLKVKDFSSYSRVVDAIIQHCVDWAAEEPFSDGPITYLKKLRDISQLSYIRGSVNRVEHIFDYKRFFGRRKISRAEYKRIVGLMREIKQRLHRLELGDSVIGKEALEEEFYRYLCVVGDALTYDDFKELLL